MTVFRSKVVSKNLLGKWILTPKGAVGFCNATLQDGGANILFRHIGKPMQSWLVRPDDLLGCRIFDTQAEAAKAAVK